MSEPVIAGAHLQVVRPTDDLAAVKKFYVDGLGFKVLIEFTSQGGTDGSSDFDGSMLGLASDNYHLEFTSKKSHQVGKAPTAENLLVFWLPDSDAWQAAVDRMTKAGYEPVEPVMSFWEPKGKTFEDPDGYRIVLQNGAWDNKKFIKS